MLILIACTFHLAYNTHTTGLWATGELQEEETEDNAF